MMADEVLDASPESFSDLYNYPFGFIEFDKFRGITWVDKIF